MKKIFLIYFIVNCSLLTVNCYSQWFQQTVPVNKPITGIKFIDSLRGWAIATNTSFDTSNVLHTTNGGTNWFVQYTTSDGGEYNAISIVDSNIIFAGGGDLSATAHLTRSTNGGLNWSVIPTPTNMSILDMVFLNKDSGWTSGASIGPDVRTTTNGGLNWTVRTSGIAPQTQRIFFLNYSTGFCAANFSLYKTTNAGVSWGLLQNFTNSVQSVFFLSEQTGWLGLSGDVASRISYTTNGGLNWSSQSLLPYILNISDVYFLNGQTGWGGIGTNKIYKTTNTGLTWGYQIDTSGSYRMSFPDSSHGWSGYSNGSISHTTNGGGQIFYTGFTSQGTEIPKQFTLYQNYPNPFNPYTTIRLDVARKSVVNLVICDVLGREKYNITNQVLDAGVYTFNWDSRDYASGVYFYRLISDKYTETKKMILQK